ncbi:MAG: TolC family protein [Gemmataceae bacterium]|nr:TolC family protein [Gemmataceae bacterium]MDW8265904.1 TolC family protein [Gemmataceae bacterium]
MKAWMPRGLLSLIGLIVAPMLGCFSSSRLADGPYPAGIRRPLFPPTLPPLPSLPSELPADPRRPESASERPKPAGEAPPAPEAEAKTLPPPRKVEEPTAPLELTEVLASVQRSFPLLLAAEQERAIAAGKRLSAEGSFDLNLRGRGILQDGTFPSERFDLYAEQATPWYGASFYGGYRLGLGKFPVYYGDRLTADGGEFRAGVILPVLRDGPIDRRRALLRQAQLGEPLADAVVRRFRIDFIRAATVRYWNWVAAGEQFFVADELLRIARDRQVGLEEQYKRGAIAEFVVIDNRRLIAEREGLLIAAERRLQQAAFDLSLYLRDAAGNPVVPPAERLPRNFLRQEPAPPDVQRLRNDVETALRFRPELDRFQALKEQASVELRLAENQTLPALNAAVGAAQDVGRGKKATGIFALDRTTPDASVLLEVPLQRRDARGRAQAARATVTQLLAQERYARDQIVVEVQDAISNLDRTHARLQRAREEQRVARRVAELELERFQKGQSNLLEVNLRELAAAGAQAKVIDALADFYRAYADYRAALGLDAAPTNP